MGFAKQVVTQINLDAGHNPSALTLSVLVGSPRIFTIKWYVLLPLHPNLLCYDRVLIASIATRINVRFLSPHRPLATCPGPENPSNAWY